MFIHILFGFLLPWAVGLYLIRKDRTNALCILLIGALIASVFNDIGFTMGWWYVTPLQYGVISFIPYNLGLFPIFLYGMIFIINRFGFRSWVVILGATLFKTILEAIYMQLGKVVYGNGWNMAWTVISYLMACSIGYSLYKLALREDCTCASTKKRPH